MIDNLYGNIIYLEKEVNRLRKKLEDTIEDK